MSKNPFINGLSASAYILLIVTVMHKGMKLVANPNPFMAPVAVISLFTLSATVMGYLFCFSADPTLYRRKEKTGN